MLLALGETLTKSERKDEAIQQFRAVLNDSSASSAHRRAAEENLKQLRQK